MKKKVIRNLKLKKKTVSKVSELDETTGGVDSFGPEICMEEFTLGCSPSFLNQCPSGPTCPISEGPCTQPPYCW